VTHDFKLPDVGEGVAEGEIVTWLVSVGDAVQEDQPVAEVETDKALVEIPSPVDGTVAELRAEEGDVVPVGEVFITFEVAGEAPAAGEAGAGAEAEAADAGGAAAADEAAPTEPDADATGGRTFAPPNVRRLARELGVDLDSVSGSGPGGRVTEGDVRAASEGAEATDVEASEADREGPGTTEAAKGADETGEPAPTTSAAAPPAPPAAAERERTLAAPATRRVARELGVDINAVPEVERREGEAFVTEAAVRQFAEARQAGAPAAAGAAAPGAVTAAPGERETREPYRGLRRTIGERMAQSKSTIPHVHSFETVEVSRLVEVRERLKPRAEAQGIHLTYMPLVMKALAAALSEFPSLNATLDEEAEEIVYHHYCNVGIATHTEAGLMVPVVEDVGQKRLLQLASEVEELAQRARDRSISREEMQGGTFTITNYGAVGGEFGTPIINHPETAILGLGRIEERPVVEDGEVVARPTLPLSLGIDHRVIDGGTEAQFRNRLKEFLREPAMLLLE